MKTLELDDLIEDTIKDYKEQLIKEIELLLEKNKNGTITAQSIVYLLKNNEI